MPATEKLILGWNVGGTTSSAVVGTSTGRIVEQQSWPSNAEQGPHVMLKEFFQQVQLLRRRFPDVSGVGVSIGGPLNPQTGVIHSPPHLPGWDDVPLRDLLVERLMLPVRVEHDAVAGLIAEWLWGAAQGCSHAVYCTAGTGFGAGIMIDSHIVRGPAGQTSEIGHIRLADSGPRAYGKNGCVESFCSGTGIALLAHEMFPDEFASSISMKELCQRSEAGSVAARKVLSSAARWTGRVCALLADLFSPQVIIAGSLARYLPDWWLEEIRAEMVREALPRNGSQTRVVAPGLGDAVQDLSALGPCLFPYGD